MEAQLAETGNANISALSAAKPPQLYAKQQINAAQFNPHVQPGTHQQSRGKSREVDVSLCAIMMHDGVKQCEKRIDL